MTNARRWTTDDFPVGFHDLHPDRGINFQLNRLYNFSNDADLLARLAATADTIHSYGDLTAQLSPMGDEALADGHRLRAALCFRAAEFAMPAGAPMKRELRERFVRLSNSYYGVREAEHYDIPYEGISLSAYRYACDDPRGTVVFLNGFDGYIEELTRLFLVFRDAGYDVVAFDGPGQGTVLEETGVPMIPEWEKPTAAVVDYFDLDDVTVVGCSLGGCLALRAAAFERRITRVICFDILPSLFESVLHAAPARVKRIVQTAVPRNIGRNLINPLLARAARKDLTVGWALPQGMHVMGSATPYDFLRSTLSFDTGPFSHLVGQDVLLLAGQDDHYVPRGQLARQIDALTDVRSLATRLFTSHEQAGNHCQLGNIGLALNTMLDWMRGIDASSARLAAAE